jgi:hypothetical protein
MRLPAICWDLDTGDFASCDLDTGVFAICCGLDTGVFASCDLDTGVFASCDLE